MSELSKAIARARRFVYDHPDVAVSTALFIACAALGFSLGYAQGWRDHAGAK